MEMTSELQDLERRLRAFHPRRPAPLPQWPVRSRLRRLIAMGVVAGAAASALIIWQPGRKPATGPRRPDVPLLGPLTTLALEHPEAFDDALSSLSRSSLPDVRQPGGALVQLAKEGP